MAPFGLLLVGFIALYASIAWGFTPPGDLTGAEGIQIYDRNGVLLFSFSDEPGSGKLVPLDEISPALIDATIATEDANFWNNPGVNFKGLVRAVYENLAFWEYGGFFNGSGGSSLSQQLAKNLYIEPEERGQRSLLRKVKETIVAFELTRRYPKENILEWYLSNIYYGNGTYGIESASYRYFDKAPSDLTLAEAALLAGIPRGPTIYDPIANFEASMDRQKQVLSLMERHGFLTEAEYEDALAAPVAIREGRDPSNAAVASNLAPHFSIYVRDLLPELLGRDGVEGNLRVTTTLDVDLQETAESILTSNLDRLEGEVDASNGSLVAMDPNTGEILAMVGSHDFFRDDISGQVNNALALNQPGSTMKPISYVSAFIKGWDPNTMILDEPLRIQNGESSYILNNADQRYRGNVTARVALGSSLNVPAVKALNYAGLENVYNLARRMGLTSLTGLSNYGVSFALGAADASLLDMTYAYSVFANEGEQAGISTVQDLPAGSRNLDPISVLQIENATGEVIWRAKSQQERILPADKVYQISSILSDDAARTSMFGTGSPLSLGSRPAAVKTGLSDDARDAWAIGYTPQLVTGVWVGNSNNKPMTGATSTFTAAPIWNAFMREALQGQTVLQFTQPSSGRQATATPAPATQAPATQTPVTPTPATNTPAPTQQQATATPRQSTSTPIPTTQPTVAQPTRTPTQQQPTLVPTQPAATATPRPTQQGATPTTDSSGS